MDVERLIHDLGALREACAAHQRNAAGAEVCRAAAAALAKLQAERDEAIDAQFTVDENCVSIGWEEVAAMWRSRATHAEARAEKAEAERDEAREALRPTDYNTLGQIGKAALDVCLPILKAHWAGGGSASMNPSLEYLDVSMGKAAMEAASRALGGGE
jgi:hypothetical protein